MSHRDEWLWLPPKACIRNLYIYTINLIYMYLQCTCQYTLGKSGVGLAWVVCVGGWGVDSVVVGRLEPAVRGVK